MNSNGEGTAVTAGGTVDEVELPVQEIGGVSLHFKPGKANSITAFTEDGVTVAGPFSVAQLTEDFTDIGGDVAVSEAHTSPDGAVEATAELDSLALGYVNANCEHAKVLQALTADKVDLESKVTHLQAENDRFMNKNRDLADKVQNLKILQESLTNGNRSMETLNAGLRSKVKALDDKIASKYAEFKDVDELAHNLMYSFARRITEIDVSLTNPKLYLPHQPGKNVYKNPKGARRATQCSDACGGTEQLVVLENYLKMIDQQRFKMTRDFPIDPEPECFEENGDGHADGLGTTT